MRSELIDLMRSVLEEATATLPEAKRTSAMQAEIAMHILASAANGERYPAAFALLAVVECSHYSHDISPERRAV